MARRLLAVLWFTASVVGGTLLAATGVALGTVTGREVVVGLGLRFANRSLDGSVTVGSVEGSLVDGLTAHDVRIVGRDSVPLATTAALSVRYRLRDLLSRRIVLGQVALDRPVINLVQDSAGGRFNFQRIFRLGGPSKGTRPLVAFRDVVIDDGDITINSPASAGDTAKGERVPEIINGREIRRIQGLSARGPYLRVSSPFPGEKGIRADIATLKTRVTDPRLIIRDGAGRLELGGDTVKLDFPSLTVGSSHASLQGMLSWPNDTILTDLTVHTRDAVLDDLRPLVSAIPRGLQGSGTFIVKSLAGDITSIGSPDLVLEGRRNGGTVTGKATMVLGPRKSWSVRGTALRVENFDLEYVRGFFDTLPIAGRLTGTVDVDGPHDHLDVTADLTYRDSLVNGWPTSTLQGAGVLTVAPPAGVTFQDFEVRESNIDLRTVQRLIPASPLAGFLAAQGVLRGPWQEMEFSGDLRHADAPLPATEARGIIQIDATGDTLGVWADLAFDSLRLPGFWSSYPSFHGIGTFAGQVRAEGYLDAIHLVMDIQGPAGRITGDGTLGFTTGFSARGLDFRFQALDVREMMTEPMGTRLAGRVTGDVSLDSGRAPEASLHVVLDTSRIGGTLVDSAHAFVSTADSVLRIDSLAAWARAARLIARGGIGLGTRRDSLAFSAALDSLGVVDPVLTSLLELPEDTARRPLAGRIVVDGVVAGSLDDFQLRARAEAPGLEWGPFHAQRAEVSGTWSSLVRGQVSIDVYADTLAYGKLAFSYLAANASGRRDSARWWIRAQNGPEASVMLAGSGKHDSLGVTVPLDSARLILPTMGWSLLAPTTLVYADSAIDVGTLTLGGTDTLSRLELTGSLPNEGHGRLSVTLRGLAMQDLFAVLQKETQSIGGRINGTIDIAGTARAPQMHSELTATETVFGDFRMPRIEGLVDYAAHRLQGAFTLREKTAAVMGITVDLPIDLALRDAAVDRELPGELAIRAIADSVDLAILEAVTGAVTNAGGRLDGDFGIVGSWEKPQLDGLLEIRDGAVTYPGAGVRHEGIQGRFVMNGDTLGIERFVLRSGTGTLDVTGHMLMERLTRPILNLHLSAREFFAMDVRNLATVTTTGEFDIHGPVIGATLTGSGTVPRGTLHFADLLYKRVINLEDTLVGEIVDTMAIRREGLSRAFQNRFIDSLNVDSARVEMGSEVWLRSIEANIQLTGRVIFSKDGPVYRADGLLNTPRGTYKLPVLFVTKEFNVTQGNIRLLGTPDLNGIVDIEARHVVRRRTGGDITVIVHIGGTLYGPIITFSSDQRPPLPEREIVSYLVFGGPVNQAGVGQASIRDIAIEGALSSLAGQFESALLANLGVPFAPDYFQLSPSISGGSEVQLGWQVTLFGFPAWVTPALGWCAKQRGVVPSPGFSVEFRLNTEFRLGVGLEPARLCSAGAVTGNNSRQAGVDLLWEKNY